MHRLYQKVDHIRASGYATLDLPSGHPFTHLNGQKFKVIRIDPPDIKSKIWLSIEGKEVEFKLSEVY